MSSTNQCVAFQKQCRVRDQSNTCRRFCMPQAVYPKHSHFLLQSNSCIVSIFSIKICNNSLYVRICIKTMLVIIPYCISQNISSVKHWWIDLKPSLVKKLVIWACHSNKKTLKLENIGERASNHFYWYVYMVHRFSTILYTYISACFSVTSRILLQWLSPMDFIHYLFASLILFPVPYMLDLLPYYLSIANGTGGVGIFELVFQCFV